MSTAIADEVRPRQRYLRSAHLEQHAAFGVDDYIPTGRALEVLHRINRALHGDAASRAWSLTGPYGSGKSSFALFLHALLGPNQEARHVAALSTLATVDADLADRLTSNRVALDAGADGFLRATATAQAEPAANTLLRALTGAVSVRWPGRAPAKVAAALRQATTNSTPLALGLLLEAMADQAPVIIVLDEFGKNLEHFAANPAAGDLFVLQELAERCAAANTRYPALLLTLQHLAFDDYVRGASATQRREWGKVQGRFEDVPFLDSADQTLRLIPAAFDTTDSSAAFRRRRAAWSAQQLQACADLGLLRLLPDAGDLLERCYPLHPLTLLALPELCSRFGQHGRTLFAFLTGHEPASVGEFMERPLPRTGSLPTVNLDGLYDFFNGPGMSASSSHAGRWLEIDTVLREATGLTAHEQRTLKTLGVLNLLAQSGPLRAHPALLSYAMTGRLADAPAKPDSPDLDTTLRSLAERGLITYRGFADEYRLWQGSDLDLARIVTDERNDLTGQSAAALLSARHRLPPAIASRHTQRVGMIRYFDTVFADRRTNALSAAAADADGLLVHWLDDPATAADVRINAVDIERKLPVVVATTVGYTAIQESLLELAAVEQALDRPDIRSDRVALRELQERTTQARRRLDDLLAQNLRPDADGSTYYRASWAGRSTGQGVALSVLPPTRSLSALLSGVCDDAYKDSPEIRNEMLGRRQLTSQAAKARRDLLEAMVTAPDVRRHGLQGYGPEVAMYEALLAHTGLHRPVDPKNPDGPWHFTSPKPNSKLGLAWGKLRTLVGQAGLEPITLDQAYAALQAPPVGLKDGPIPLLIAALLLQNEDTVAVYQDGSYQPRLGADTLERLVKSPDRFSIKTFSADGDRAALLDRLRQLLGQPGGNGRRTSRSKMRNSTVLDVAAPLITAAAALPIYTRKTTSLAADTIAVRTALLTSRQPDELLFDALPQACGIAPVAPGEAGREPDIATLHARLDLALADLRGAYQTLLEDCAALLAADFGTELAGLNELPALRTRLRNAAAPLADVPLMDRRLKAFVLAVLDVRESDQAWLEALLSLVTGLPATSWQDADQARYRTALPALGEQLRRLVALHTATAARGAGGFDAHRVTLTRPDGQEHARVVWVDHRVRGDLDETVDVALQAARALLGAHGDEALLALLAGRVLAAQQPTDGTLSAPASAPFAPPQEGRAHA